MQNQNLRPDQHQSQVTLTLQRRRKAEQLQALEASRAFSYQASWLSDMTLQASMQRYDTDSRLGALWATLQQDAKRLHALGQRLDSDLELRSVGKWRALKEHVDALRPAADALCEAISAQINRDLAKVQTAIDSALEVPSDREALDLREVRDRLRQMPFTEALSIVNSDPRAARAWISAPSKCLLPKEVDDKMLQNLRQQYLEAAVPSALLTEQNLRTERNLLDRIESATHDALGGLEYQCREMVKPASDEDMMAAHSLAKAAG